jgi:hypothetical protein
LQFIDARLDSLIAKPSLWGGREGVELQILQLLEFRALVLRPNADARQIFTQLRDAYARFVRKSIPNCPPAPLSALLDDDDLPQLVAFLSQFRQAWEPAFREDNPFEVYDLALRLRLRGGVITPKASSIGRYYETFRRVVRGVARPKPIGRTPKEIEEATDFLSPDLEISVANGKPGSVLLPLKLPPPTGAQTTMGFDQSDAQRVVLDAMTHLATVAEWAGGNASPTELSSTIPDDDRRRRLAFQALRLLPRSGIEVVEFGGSAIGRLKPVELRPAMARELNTVMREGVAPQPREVNGTVRMVDLDLGSIAVRPDGARRREMWWLSHEIELPGNIVGARVEVRGEEFADPLGHKMLIANEMVVLNLEEGVSDDDDNVDAA